MNNWLSVELIGLVFDSSFLDEVVTAARAHKNVTHIPFLLELRFYIGRTSI